MAGTIAMRRHARSSSPDSQKFSSHIHVVIDMLCQQKSANRVLQQACKIPRPQNFIWGSCHHAMWEWCALEVLSPTASTFNILKIKVPACIAPEAGMYQWLTRVVLFIGNHDSPSIPNALRGTLMFVLELPTARLSQTSARFLIQIA